MSFFAKTDTGVTLNRFSQDLELIDMELPLSVINTVISKRPSPTSRPAIALLTMIQQFSQSSSPKAF